MAESTSDQAARSQVVEKTCTILRAVADRGRNGARLVDLTSATGLSRPTIHRILQSLMLERFIQQRESRRYFLGPALFEIGMVAPSPLGDLEPYRAIIQDLADKCGDTVYLAMRRGNLALYLLRCEGAFPIRTHFVNVGETLPLVGGHSGRSLLAAMDDDEVEEVILRTMRTPKLFGAGNPTRLREEIARVRASGYGWAQDVTFQGVAGISAPVPSPIGRPYLAVSISAISERLNEKRAKDLAKPLQRAAAAIGALLAGRRGGVSERLGRSRKVG